MTEQLIIRDLADGTLEGLKKRAAEVGMSREAWLRQQIEALAAVPASRDSYRLTALGAEGAKATLVRYGGAAGVGGGARDLSQEQADAYQQAKLLVSRNGPGDRERAIGLFSAAFEDVFEGAV